MRRAGGGEARWSQEHFPVVVGAPGFVPHCQVGHDDSIIGEGRHLVLCDLGLVSAEGARDEARPVGDVQDLNEAAAANPVQAVQDLRLAVVGIVALITDFTLQFLWWRTVLLLDLSLSTAHLQVMFWERRETH